MIGPGRAGGSIGQALASVGWEWVGSLGRGDALTNAAEGVELLVIAVPDASIADVAQSVEPGEATVIHLSGSRPLTDLASHQRTGSLHPLVSLPDPDRGAELLGTGATFAVAGDRMVDELVDQLGGRVVRIDDEQRALYHATASVAANHLVALAAQVERLAKELGVPVDAYWDLMAGALDNVRRGGAREALTGPAARGDWDTVAAHLVALPPAERALYEILSREAAALAEQPWMDRAESRESTNDH